MIEIENISGSKKNYKVINKLQRGDLIRPLKTGNNEGGKSFI